MLGKCLVSVDIRHGYNTHFEVFVLHRVEVSISIVGSGGAIGR